MTSTHTMARIIGPFLLILGASLALRAQAMTPLIGAFIGDTPLLLLTGVVTLAIGLIMIAAHQRWNGPAAIIISLFGWLTAIRGAVILLGPDLISQIWAQVIVAPHTFWIAGGVMALIGIYLTFVGWFTKPAA